MGLITLRELLDGREGAVPGKIETAITGISAPSAAESECIRGGMELMLSPITRARLGSTDGAAGDSIWMDLGYPVMTSPE